MKVATGVAEGEFTFIHLVFPVYIYARQHNWKRIGVRKWMKLPAPATGKKSLDN